MRHVRGLFWSLLAAISLSAAPLVAMAQDGLQRFERDVKPQLEFEKFTYGSASALGPNGFVLNDVVAVIPASEQTGGKSSTVKIVKVTAEEIDFERLQAPKDKSAKDKDDMPRFAKIRLEGMTGDDDISNMFTAYGIPRVPADVTLDYRLDTDHKVFTLNKLEIVLQGQARTELSLVLDGVSDKASKLEFVERRCAAAHLHAGARRYRLAGQAAAGHGQAERRHRRDVGRHGPGVAWRLR